MQEIVLSNEQLSIGVLPSCGASLSFLKYKQANKEQDILRPMNKDKAKDANSASLFLMLPYCGRIRGGSFTYWGILRKVPKNQFAISDPIHGDGWKSEWRIVEQTQSKITLEFVHNKEQGGFPFSYSAEVTYQLEKNELKIGLSVYNPAPLPMPCGLGIHPFFLKEKNVHLDFKTDVVWSNESDPIFDKPYLTPEPWQFDGGKPLKSAVFDTCFGGFEENAKIIYPDRGISVNMTTNDLFHHVVLYAPKGKNFFCLEPTTCASNAFNLAANGVIGTGIRSIGPQQKIEGQITLKIQG